MAYPMEQNSRTSKAKSEVYSPARTAKLVFEMAQTLLPRLPDDVADVVAPLLEKRDLRALLPLIKTTPHSVWGNASYFDAWYQLQGLFKKVPWAPSESGLPDPEETALEGFLATERKCARTNKRFSNRHWRKDVHLSRLITDTQRIIRRILRKVDINTVKDRCRWSGGATTTVFGESTHLAAKWDGEWGVTPEAYHRATTWLAMNPDFQLELNSNGMYGCFDLPQAVVAARSMCTVTSCAEVQFVPKTAWVHRVIMKPVLLNNYVQNGIGDVLRDALLAEGIDLRDQSLNQKLAWLGATTGRWATLDLSSASDLIAHWLVRLLLPADWFDLLWEFREGQCKLPNGEVLRLEKMCGMGNGYCFPLQTLIFYALAKAAGASQCRVYGDDIIVKREVASSVMFALNRCGFKVNSDKSFWTGPFRESCGSNWYGARDVTPVYVRSRKLKPRDAIVLHNQFLRKGYPFDSKILQLLRAYSVKADRFVGVEDDLSDGYYLAPQDVVMASEHSRWDRARQTWDHKVWREVGKPDKATYNPVAVYWMRLLGGTPTLRYRARTISSWRLPKEEKPFRERSRKEFVSQ